MSQRNSGYERRADEDYQTIAWPIVAVLLKLDPIKRAWDPCDRGDGLLVKTLRAQGVRAIGTSKNFFSIHKPPPDVDTLLTNPPYGSDRKGTLAVHFIEHALELEIPRIAMLLRADFDSAISRQHLFRHNKWFAGKVVLLNRIKWFAGPSSPSDNHAWFFWDRWDRTQKVPFPPSIRYVSKQEADAVLNKQGDLFGMKRSPARNRVLERSQ